MNLSIMRSLLVGGILSASLAVSAVAQANIQIATVDLERTFQEYHKAQEARERLQRQAERAQADMADMQEEGEILQERFRTVVQRLQNPATSDEAREEAQEEAQSLQQQLQLKQQELQEHFQRTQETLQRRERSIISSHIDEIRQVVHQVASERDVDLVLNSNPGANQVLFVDASFDITDEVIAKLNAEKADD